MSNTRKSDEIISIDAHNAVPNYSRYPVVLERGEKATLYDTEGKKYIDFTSGIGVNSLGVGDIGWINAVTSQISKIQHVSNYFYSPVSVALTERLTELTGMKKAFLCNSGAEANEAAIKTARKYSFDKYGKGRSTIIALYNSFHGRTITTLAATGQEVFHNYFFPFTEGFKFVHINDFEQLQNAITPDVCAILAEPIQGEGGVNVMTNEFAKLIHSICEKNDILSIFDEIQTGVARTGRIYAFQHFGFIPDIITSAKGLGGGLPIGAMICGEKTKDVLSSGTHGTTFGGNPVVCAGALEVLRRVSAREFMMSVGEKGRYITEKLLKMDLPNIIQIRGKGLMIGIKIDGDPKDYVKKGIENGLLMLTAGKDVIRLLPPLVISHDEIDEGINIFEKIMK